MNSEKNRILVVSVTCTLLALVILSRLFYLQMLRGKDFTEKVETGVATASTGLDRGTVFFSQKDGTLVSAATTVRGFTVVVDKTIAKNNATIIPTIAESTGEEVSVLEKKLSTSPSKHVDLVKKVTQVKADELRLKKLPGVAFRPEPYRFYPGGMMGARTLGFVAFKGQDLEGRYGIERFYNPSLSRPPENIYGNFFTQVFSNINESIKKSDTPKGDIITTLEPQVQQKLDSQLLSAKEKYNADAAGGIVIDPVTGNILAMSYIPGFNLNDFSGVTDPAIFSNPNVENVFEFGSVMKPLVMAAALDMGVVTAETTYVDKGILTFNNKTIQNFDKKAHGTQNMQYVLSNSLNTGMVFVMQQMGHQKFKDYLFSYGLNEKTGIDLPNESGSLMNNLKTSRELEYANASFGQGIAVTPIQAARAYSVLANGGNLISPRVADKIKNESGSIDTIKKPEATQILKSETSDEITRMLVNVVDKGLGGGAYKNEHYSIAAKTGTAQIAGKEGYNDSQYLHSLFGYYPAYNPRFLVLMYIVDPKGVRFAASTLADPFFDFSKFLLGYYEIAPDR